MARRKVKRQTAQEARHDKSCPPCKSSPRLVVVGTHILTIQARLTTIAKRQDVLQTEFDRLDEEKATKLQDLGLLQREMDKLTSTHHVVSQ